MPQSLSKVYIHIVFSTKYRHKLIDEKIEDDLFEYIGGICKGLGCNPIQIGGYQDHIHVLCQISRKVPLMDLVEELKKRSSKWIKTKGDSYKGFYWQNGYGVFSVNPSQINVVVTYIKNQKKHHASNTFKEEYRSFLKKYEVEYDERYVWD